MRSAACLLLLFAACSASEERCLLMGSRAVTEGEARALVNDGGVVVSYSPECGACVYDETVEPGSLDAPAQGYCAASCAATSTDCPEGTRCELGACVRVQRP